MDKDDQRMQPSYNMAGAEPISKFNGEDMTYSSSRWAQDIEDNAEIFGWTPHQKLIMARRSLSGTAELWLKTEKTFRTYEELKAALQKEFSELVNSKQMHEVMAARKKRNSESYYQYMLSMKELGKRAKFPDYVAIQYIVDGIMDYEQNKMCLYGITTYPALKEKLTQYEVMKQKMKQRGERGGQSSKPRERESVKTSSDKVGQANDKPIQRCFKCGEKGHIATACEKGVKCFKCNHFGHVATQCTATITNEASGTRKTRNVGDDNIRSPRTSMFVSGAAAVVNEINEASVECPERKEQMANVTSSLVQCNCQCQNPNLDVLSVNNNSAVLNKSIKIAKVGAISVKCLIDTGSVWCSFHMS